MKNLEIKKVKYSTNGPAVIGVQKETVALPDLEKDILYVDGTEEYFTIKGVKTDGSYWGGYFLFQQSDVVTLSESFKDFIKYVSDNNIGGYRTFNKEYLDAITQYDAKEPPSVYGGYRANFKRSFLDFLKTDNTVLEVKVTQSLQDTKLLEMLAKDWENTIASNNDNTQTYRQGKLPMFVNKPAILSMLISCATCENLENGGLNNPYNIVGSSYPGANVRVFESYAFYDGVSMQDVDNQLTAGIAEAIDESCSRFVNKMKPEGFSEITGKCQEELEQEKENLEDQVKNIEEEQKNKESERADAKETQEQLEEQLAKINEDILTLKQDLEDIESEYAECLDAAGSDPSAIAACTEAYNQAKNEKEEELKEKEGERTELQKELTDTNEQISSLDAEIASLENQLAVAQGALQNVEDQTNSQEKCADMVEAFCESEEPPGQS